MSDLSFSTGMDALDEVIQGVLPGDNIVFKVDDIEDYVWFVNSFVQDANKNNRELIYFRFAEHQRLIGPEIDAEVYELNPDDGFEFFIAKILRAIEKFGRGACYVFDCLSDLAVDWYSDQMLANFFMITCPYLYDFETGTYFAILRNKHGTETVKSIQNTAQVIIDVYNYKNNLYILPIKVIERHSNTMYMLHKWTGIRFIPVTQSPVISGILTTQTQPWVDLNTDLQDLWSRVFHRANHLNELDPSLRNESEVQEYYERFLRMAISRNEKLIALLKKYLDLEDLLKIGKRMVGTGLIGGKSVGMLLAQAIIKKHDSKKWNEKLEIHDSFFIGSDVFYTYLVVNKCWWLRHRIKKVEDFSDMIKELKVKVMIGRFPEIIVNQFKRLLNYFGQSPIIVRSSSLLEDAYGNAFSGKYESVFLANQGNPEQRLFEFMNAVRIVYSSTMSKEALTYRRKRGILINQDEQMAILVQRVSGNLYDNFFYPHIAGVGYSYNPFVWNEKIKPESGLLRLVFGLGTRAVDRSDDDYTRIVALNAPSLLPDLSLSDQERYTQRKVDIIDLIRNQHTSHYFEDIVRENQDIPLDVFATRNWEYERMMEQRGKENVFSYSLSFDTLLNYTDFSKDMQEILTILQQAYNYPVDIEFTANFLDNSDYSKYKINLLQCRPFQYKKSDARIKTPDYIPEEELIFTTKGPIIGQNKSIFIERIVYVEAEEYGQLSIQERYEIARLIGRINNLTKNKEEKVIMLMGPGRWGTSSPSLGVPASFSEINNTSVICEIAEMHKHLIPDVSLGTHFFNDLVETNMIYLAIHPNREFDRINKNNLKKVENLLPKLLPKDAQYQNIVKLLDFSGEGKIKLRLDADTFKQKAVCYFYKE